MNGWDRDDAESIQERAVEARLALAQAFVAVGKADDAERLYKQTLGHAEASAGENSPLGLGDSQAATTGQSS